MSDYKAIGIIFIRSHLRAKGSIAEAPVVAALTPPERGIYEKAVATDWVPIELASQLMHLSAPLLYPQKANPIRHLGHDLAQDNLRGVYRFIVRVLTVPFLLSQAATLWQTYHRQGKGRIERLEEKSVDFIVEGYPRLPERFRECMSGWIAGAVELTGTHTVAVTRSDADRNAWRWCVRWR